VKEAVLAYFECSTKEYSCGTKENHEKPEVFGPIFDPETEGLTTTPQCDRVHLTQFPKSSLRVGTMRQT